MTAYFHHRDRYQAFIARLAAEDAPNVGFVAAYMEDVTADPDRVMAESAMVALLNHPALSEALLDDIQSAMPISWSAAAAHLDERRIKLRIEADPSDPVRWDRAVSSGSRRLHLWLLDQPALPAETLHSLATNGATKAVRNRAAQAHRRESGA